MAESPPPPGGFLPPEPAGREPDLGTRPAQPPPPPAPGYAPPAHAPQSPQPPQPPQWKGNAQAGPDNGPAVVGFCLSLSSLGLLFVSAGLSSLVSVGLAIPGMLQSRKGTRLVQQGHTTRNAGLASAGWVVGIVSLVLSVLATIFWILIGILIATDDEVREEFERELDQYERSSATALLVVARLAGAALT